jgi:quinoprotein relay system zinc metallohydrolase 2
LPRRATARAGTAGSSKARGGADRGQQQGPRRRHGPRAAARAAAPARTARSSKGAAPARTTSDLGGAVSVSRYLSRRDALSGVCACCFAGLTRAAPSATTDQTLATDEVAPGIHIRRGVDEDATPANQGAIANIGFIIGRDAVAVMDPGGSLADGQRLHATIRKATSLPIRYVVMSHVHPDHIFGAGAFAQDKPQFVGHALLPTALAQRGEYYRLRLDQILGAGQSGPIITPTLLVKDRDQVDLGGRVLEITAHGNAHTDCDLSVLDRQTGTLLLSDLLFVQRVPSLDGSLKGWLAEIAKLKNVAARRAVPGHGPTGVDWPAASRDLERYLGTLLRETREAIAKGVDIGQAAKTVALSERDKWTLFDDYNGHNVTRAYKELEWD